MHTPHISWFLTVVVPYLALASCFILLRGGGNRQMFQKTIDVSVDFCVLGLGVWAALVGTAEAQSILGSATTKFAVTPIVFFLFLIAIWVRLRESAFNLLDQARISVLIGMLPLGANSGLVWFVDHYYHHGAEYWPCFSIWMAIGAGLLAWLMPSVCIEPIFRAKRRWLIPQAQTEPEAPMK